MKLTSIIAATLLFAASFGDALPTQNKAATVNRLSGLEKIKHIVYFMQENRSFDNYYGTMYGVRGFQDPNIGIQKNGLNLLYQPDASSSDVLNNTKYLLPYQLKGNRAGCTAGGTNSWSGFHGAINGGLNNNWPAGNSPASMGYLNRTQIPFLYSLADEFTIADMYFQSVAGSTNPNRVYWISGTNQGAPNNYVLEDNTESTPLEWSTYPEMLTNASINWQVYQDKDNFDDNPLAWFKHWQNLPTGAEKTKGVGYLGLDTFYAQAANGTLPQISYIIGPTELSEHPNNTPLAGSWLQQQIVNAVTNGPNWNSTALFINYDEAGGYFDHVVPPMEPQSSWVTDKFNGNKTYVGFGPRVPMVVISPWTRGGNVFSETSDHTSTLMFLEEWIGKDSNGNYVAPAENVSPFHRSTSSNLYNIFDFNNPDYSVPKFDAVPKPAQVGGVWDPTEMCEILTDKKTTPPYGKQVVPIAESGSRPIRGAVTLGRTIAIQASTGEMISVASSGTNNKMTISAKKSSLKKRAASHSLSKEAAFTLIETGTKHEFKIQSVAHPSTCVNVWGNGIDLSECKGTSWKFDSSNGNHHLIDVGTSSYLNIKNGKVQLSKKKNAPFTIFSVTL